MGLFARMTMMKIDSIKNAGTTGRLVEELSEIEVDAISGGSFKLANPGQVNPNFFNRVVGPLKGGYVFS